MVCGGTSGLSVCVCVLSNGRSDSLIGHQGFVSSQQLSTESLLLINLYTCNKANLQSFLHQYLTVKEKPVSENTIEREKKKIKLRSKQSLSNPEGFRYGGNIKQ